jgi:hypothetical protein
VEGHQKGGEHWGQKYCLCDETIEQGENGMMMILGRGDDGMIFFMFLFFVIYCFVVLFYLFMEINLKWSYYCEIYLYWRVLGK